MSKYRNKIGQTYDTDQLTKKETRKFRFEVLDRLVYDDTAITNWQTGKDDYKLRGNLYSYRFIDDVWCTGKVSYALGNLIEQNANN